MDTVKFKDVAHLYLGVKGYRLPSWTERSPVFELDCERLEGIKERNGYFMPHLRKLDSQTEQENEEVKKIWFDSAEWENKIGISTYAVTTKWYLDKHFDLFNLIENGEAIEALNKTS